jgi:polysaccharide deacetylase 2 family uncharacterized protein YibQ
MSYIRQSLIVLLGMSILGCLFVVSGCKPKADPDEAETEEITPETEYASPDTIKADSTKADNSATIKYTYNWSADKDFPPVAIVIDDFGYIGGNMLQGFAELDEAVSFAILPDLPNSKKTAQIANIHGHEVILHVPMQALDAGQSPGKTFIKAGDSKERITELLAGYLEQIPQAVGANNHMGSKATSDYQVMLNVLSTLHTKGLFFLDSKTNGKSKVINAATELKIDYAARDIFLDVPDVSATTLNAKLKELEKYRGRVEPVIIISHCHNQAKLDAMRSFVNQLKGMGVRLIPISDAVKKFSLPA